MKPIVICHMMSSTDGRTLTGNWNKPKGMGAYETIHKGFKADAWIAGRTTMERDFANKRPLKLKGGPVDVPAGDFVAEHKAKSFAIAVDRGGKLHWQQSAIEGDHLIVVLTEQADKAYRADLRQKGISYIIGGKTDVDFRKVLEKLNALFSIKKLMLEGGGHLNRVFLRAGLIDELSLLILPLADGSPDSPSIFEPGDTDKKIPVHRMKLLQVKKLQHDVLWLRYKMVN